MSASKPKKSKSKKTKTVKKEVGRPSAFKEEYCEQAYKLCLIGITDKQMSDFFGISESTLNLWKKKHPSFSESLKKGKYLSDAEVGSSLFQRACGYEHDDIHFSAYEGQVTETPYRKRYAPDTIACIFWLKNRQRSQWQNNPEEVDDNAPILPRQITIQTVSARKTPKPE